MFLDATRGRVTAIAKPYKSIEEGVVPVGSSGDIHRNSPISSRSRTWPAGGLAGESGDLPCGSSIPGRRTPFQPRTGRKGGSHGWSGGAQGGPTRNPWKTDIPDHLFAPAGRRSFLGTDERTPVPGTSSALSGRMC